MHTRVSESSQQKLITLGAQECAKHILSSKEELRPGAGQEKPRKQESARAPGKKSQESKSYAQAPGERSQESKNLPERRAKDVENSPGGYALV